MCRVCYRPVLRPPSGCLLVAQRGHWLVRHIGAGHRAARPPRWAPESNRGKIVGHGDDRATFLGILLSRVVSGLPWPNTSGGRTMFLVCGRQPIALIGLATLGAGLPRFKPTTHLAYGPLCFGSLASCGSVMPSCGRAALAQGLLSIGLQRFSGPPLGRGWAARASPSTWGKAGPPAAFRLGWCGQGAVGCRPLRGASPDRRGARFGQARLGAALVVVSFRGHWRCPR